MQRLTPIVEFGLPIMEPRDRGLYVLHSEAQATITHLTTELEAEKAKRGAIIEKAAKVVEDTMLTYPSGQSASDDVAAEIRALATEDETADLAEIVKQAVDAETRACVDLTDRALLNYGGRQESSTGKEARDWQSMKMAALDIRDAILARIDQRKEAGE